MRKMRILALLLLVSLVALVGCGGGGGGGESQISPEKDVAGITGTLDKFAAALKSGDVSSTGLFAQTTSAQSTTILYVKDFGADLSNPADNQTWEFSVRPENITQTSLDKAIVRASKVMTTGKTLWLVFAMVREQGVWYIDGITVEETGTEGAFVVQRYYPIVPGASMKYLEQGTSPVLYYTDGFSSTDRVEKNGIIMYRTSSFDETSPMVPSIRAQRAQLFDNAGFYVGYNSSGELWAYSSLVNGGQPYRLFKTAYALGQKEVVTETTANGTFVTTMTIGSKTELMTTPLRTFSTIPVTEEVSFLIAGAPATETSIIYFADGIGVVAIKDFGYNLTTPDSTDLLFERYVNGVFDRNLPIVSPPAGSQNVVVGQAMTPVQFAAAGGTGPMTWSVANAPVGVTINSTTGSMSGTPDPSAPLMTWNTIVTATDIYGRQGTSQYNIAVVAAPALTVNSTTSAQQVVVGQPMTAVQFSATNGTGAIAWSLGTGAPVGITLSTGGLLSGTVDPSVALGDYTVTINARDQIGGTGSKVFTISVVNPPALTVNSTGNSQLVPVGRALTPVQFSTIGNTGAVTWSIGAAPVGISISSTGVLSGTVDPSTALGDYPVTVSVIDSIGGNGSKVYTITVIQPPPLTITPANANQTTYAGGTIQPVTFTAEGGVGGITWSISGQPSNIGIGSTGILSGTVNAGTALGTYVITVTGTDSLGTTGSTNYTIGITSPPAITITSSDGGNSQRVVVGQSMTSVTFSGTGNTGGITWSCSGQPSNIGIGSTGILSGTVVSSTAAGDYTVTVTATDSIGGTGTFQYVLQVVPGEYFMPSYYPTVPGDEYTYAQLPNLSPVPDRTLVTVLSDSLSLPVDGGETVTFYKESTSNVAPTGLNIRAAVRKNLRGALRAQTTPEDVYYRGLDSTGNIWQYNPIINGGVPYKIFPAWMNPGETFQFTQNYNDGVNPAYSATTDVVIGSALVNGVETPLGTYNNLLNITYLTTIYPPSGSPIGVASDLFCAKNIGLVAYYSYTDQTMSTIDYKEQVLTTKLAGIINDNPVQINTPALLSYSNPVDITLNASGGDSANGYVWSLVSGTMPANLGLSSNGRLTGTPTISGTYTFTLKVTDYYYRSATKAFTMTVP